MIRNALKLQGATEQALHGLTYYAEQATGNGSSCYGAENDQSKKTSCIPTGIALQKRFYQRRRHLQRELGGTVWWWLWLSLSLSLCPKGALRHKLSRLCSVHIFMSWHRCGSSGCVLAPA